MRIRSNFHDYYDSVQRHGQDERLEFVREMRRIELSDTTELTRPWRGLQIPDLPAAEYSFSGGRLCLSALVVLFAGKRYTALQVSRYSSYDSAEPAQEVRHFYAAERALWYLAAHLSAEQLDAAPANGKRSLRVRVTRLLSAQGTTELSAWATSERVPIAVLTLRSKRWRDPHRSLVINPRLANIGFYAVVEPWQAYQELAMFLGGIAAPENHPPVQLTDRELVAKHGFDERSFRKPPSK
ncbi:hypothetical protein D3C71_24310 [compost metagenome]